MKIIKLAVCLAIIFISCRKEYLIPYYEVPEWLKSNIKHEEKVIHDSPQLMNSYGAWIRYFWQNEPYFEYHNELSSSLPRPISFNHDTLHIYATDTNTDYFKEKCCKQYVWKAPDYKEYLK